MNPAYVLANGTVVMIPPGTAYPATMVWLPGAEVAGKLKGNIVCQATALSDAECLTVQPPCTSNPAEPHADANLVSGRVTVATMAALSEPPAAGRVSQGGTFQIGFLIVNTFAIDVRLKIEVHPTGRHEFPRGNLRIELGKAKERIRLGVPASLTQPFHTGKVPRRLFEELVDHDAKPLEGFDLESGGVRQGLLELSLPENAEPAAQVIRVSYQRLESGKDKTRPFGSFSYNLADHVPAKDGGARKEEAKAKR